LRSPLKLCLVAILFCFSSVFQLQIMAQAARGHALDANIGPPSVESESSSSAAAVQVGPGPQLPQPGQPGSPFPVDHFWKRVGFEAAGGFSPTVNRGVGYYGPGYTITVGALDRFSPHLGLMVEGQILGQQGNFLYVQSGSGSQLASSDRGSYMFAFHLDPVYDLEPNRKTSPFLVAGGGYYHLGTHFACVASNTNCDSTGGAPFETDSISVNAAGFNVGAGIRHRLYADRHTEIFADARYHFIASGSSAVGQVSLLPVSTGIRW